MVVDSADWPKLTHPSINVETNAEIKKLFFFMVLPPINCFLINAAPPRFCRILTSCFSVACLIDNGRYPTQILPLTVFLLLLFFTLHVYFPGSVLMLLGNMLGQFEIPNKQCIKKLLMLLLELVDAGC